jgi:hypothetical protein
MIISLMQLSSTILVLMLVATTTTTTTTITAFQQQPQGRAYWSTTKAKARTSIKTILYADISEWRDIMFENQPDLGDSPRRKEGLTLSESSLDDDNEDEDEDEDDDDDDDDDESNKLRRSQEKKSQQIDNNNNEQQPLRQICVLPFPLTDILLQGETKELCLYEERFHKLFDYSTKYHAGIVAMGYIANAQGLLQCMPLCEIENYRVMEGDDDDESSGLYSSTGKSILATIRVVGRATLQKIQNNDDGGIEDVFDEYITAWCTEFTDDNSNNSNIENNSKNNVVEKDKDKNVIDVCNELANDIDEMFDSIISLEEQLELKQQQKSDDGDGDGDNASTTTNNKDGAVLSEATLRRMKLEAELGLDDDDDNEDDDDDDDDDEYLDDDEEQSRKSLFKKAYQIAKSSDTQGYTILNTEEEEEMSTTTTNNNNNSTRSIQDLTALSWAYLSKDVWQDKDDDEILKFRLQALNINNLLDRLILIYKMMLEQRGKLIDKKLEF